MTKRLVVRTNVRRDLLQSAQVFRNEKLVVWEYVSNSLQYVDAGVNAQVDVTIDTRGRRIVIRDNGRGMDIDGLRNFFVMHGENLDRVSGRGGRGRFGTGKSAAFGIARTLRVTSVRYGKRCTVELTKDAIDVAGDDHIPLKVIESEIECDSPNGTIVEIEQVQIRRLDPDAVIRYLERHLARWPGRPSVAVNSHECEPREPTVVRRIECKPNPDVTDLIGDVVLTLKVATAPLESEQQGVSIFANGVWLSTTLAGLEGQPMANHIFGEIDVPMLDDDSAPIPAFDMTRSMQLNAENPVVCELLPFVGREIDKLRRELVHEDRERRAEAENKRLQREANQIAGIINDDFAEYSQRLQRLHSRGGRGRDKTAVPSGAAKDGLLAPSPTGIPGEETDHQGGPSRTGRGGAGSGSDQGSLLKRDSNGQDRGNPIGENTRRRARGGFRVDFDSLGDREPRAKYVREERVILVNLDHPQIRAARGCGGIECVAFRRLAYEVAFGEYAIALAYEIASNQDYLDPTDAIYDIRETMNRMATRSAALYAED